MNNIYYVIISYYILGTIYYIFIDNKYKKQYNIVSDSNIQGSLSFFESSL